MEKQIKNLLSCLWTEYLLSWSVTICLVILYEFGVLKEGTYAGDASMNYLLQTIGILLVIALIPISLGMFNSSIDKNIKNLDIICALKSYRRWSEIRISLLTVSTVCNISFYYLTMNSTGTLCAAMSLIALLFCIPSRKNVISHLDLIK